MTERDEIIGEGMDHNLRQFMTRGPGIRSTNHRWIVARDPDRRMVLVGGLGGIGVGEMWVEEKEHHRSDLTYADAPIRRAVTMSEAITEWLER
jgi:hypothetical protein